MTVPANVVPHGLAGRAGLVTGAAGGIGRALSFAIVEAGGSVFMSDVDEGRLRSVAAELGQPDRVRTHVADLTDEKEVEDLVVAAAAGFGRLDFAINNAGIAGRTQSFVDVTLETWHRTIATNLTSVFLCMRAELREMTRQGAGAIVNFSSASAFRPPPGLPHYVASKNGVLGLTKSASLEFAARGIRVNTVVPGSIDTPMLRETMGDDPTTIAAVSSRWAAGRMGEPTEVANVAVWLASPAASFVNGAYVVVDGGMLSL